MGKVSRAANRNPFFTSILMSLLIVIVGVVFVQRSATKEAKDRAVVVATASIETCKAAVAAVSLQIKTDDLKILTVIKQRYSDTGRPVPPIFLALEAEVRARQAPLGACNPKEKP